MKSKHITASNRKNRKPRGQAIDTSFGSKVNQNGSKKNYGLVRHGYDAIQGKSIFA